MVEKAQLLAQRDYDFNYLKIAKEEIKAIEKYLSYDYQAKLEACYSDSHEARKVLINPFEITDEDFVKSWINIPYIPKGFNDNDSTDYYTEKSERVRSKSEVIIANTLNLLNIPYKYECPLQLDQTTIYPDFTILNVNKRKVIYLEHFGLMGDPDYVSNMMLKISTYERNGIFVGDTLICTFESSRKPLSNGILKRKLEQLVLGKY